MPKYSFKNPVVRVSVAEIFVGPGVSGNDKIKTGCKQVFGVERKFSHKCGLFAKINATLIHGADCSEVLTAFIPDSTKIIYGPHIFRAYTQVLSNNFFNETKNSC